MNRYFNVVVGFAVFVLSSSAVDAQDYEFNGKISRPVLENYLARSITMLDLLTGKGNVDDNIRMLKNTDAKFAGRSIYLWGGEGQLPAKLVAARQNSSKTHATDPELILQACVFEIVSEEVEKLPLPAWVFEAFGQSPEQRNFRYEAMLGVSGYCAMPMFPAVDCFTVIVFYLTFIRFHYGLWKSLSDRKKAY